MVKCSKLAWKRWICFVAKSSKMAWVRFVSFVAKCSKLTCERLVSFVAFELGEMDILLLSGHYVGPFVGVPQF